MVFSYIDEIFEPYEIIQHSVWLWLLSRQIFLVNDEGFSTPLLHRVKNKDSKEYFKQNNFVQTKKPTSKWGKEG